MCLEIKCEGILGKLEDDLFVGYKEFVFMEDGVYSYYYNTRYNLAIRTHYLWTGIVDVSAEIKKQDVELVLHVRNLQGIEDWIYQQVDMDLGVHIFPFSGNSEELKVVVQGGVIPVVFKGSDVMLVGRDIVVERLLVFPPNSPIQQFVTDETWEAYKEIYQLFRTVAYEEILKS